jgi:hypothetical protein
MKKQVRTWLRWSGGILLILLGIAGGFIPVLQGWVLILAGLAVIAPEYPPAARLLAQLRARWQHRRHRGRPPVQSAGESAPPECSTRR